MLGLKARLRRLERRVHGSSRGRGLGPSGYPNDPVGYAHHVLGFYPTPDQIEIAAAIRRPPYRVMAPSGHNTGKSAAAAWLINWFYDSFRPSQCISTAPTLDSVKKIIWKEVRMMRHRAGLGDLQPKAPEMSDSPDHVAYGMTAGSGEGFQGRHELQTFFVFDEACDIDPVFWSVTRTMFKPEHGHMWLALYNPTDTTSQAFMEDHSTDADGRPIWTTIRMDCLRHPNIVRQLRGEAPLIPSAVTLSQVQEWVAAWCDEISPDDAGPTDLVWPPREDCVQCAVIGGDCGRHRTYRQGPEFQARCRGMWPEGGTYAVWSELVWRQAESILLKPGVGDIPEIGIDVASYGLDYSSFHVRWGPASMAHESYQGWGPRKIFERAKELAWAWAERLNETRSTSAAKVSGKVIPIKIDDDPEGRAISEWLQADGYNVIPVGAATRSISGLYRNMRNELWFQTMMQAREGRVSFARLPKEIRERMRQQAMAVEWRLDGQGRREVEAKEVTKEKIGRSPDDMDACNLAFLQGFEMDPPQAIGGNERRNLMDPEEAKNRERPKRRLFG